MQKEVIVNNERPQLAKPLQASGVSGPEDHDCNFVNLFAYFRLVRPNF